MIPSLPQNSIAIGPLTFHLYGLILGLSLIITYQLAQKWASKHNLSTKLIDTLYVTTIPLALIGARTYHVLSNWDFYSNNLSQVFAIWNGGIGILGGIITGTFVLLIIARQHKISLFKLTDFIAPLLALGQAIGRWGNYVNQELYGQPTNLPWGLQIDESHRLSGYTHYSTFHPLFLYESILNFLNFLILWKISKKRFTMVPTSVYLINYGLIRFILEFLKIDPDTTNILLGLKTAQYISLGMIIIGIILLINSKKRHAAIQK